MSHMESDLSNLFICGLYGINFDCKANQTIFSSINVIMRFIIIPGLLRLGNKYVLILSFKLWLFCLGDEITSTIW